MPLKSATLQPTRRDFSRDTDRDDHRAANPADRARDLRNAILCALAVAAAVLSAWPFADLAFNDDWSYGFTVKRLLETGRVTYNGWASPAFVP